MHDTAVDRLHWHVTWHDEENSDKETGNVSHYAMKITALFQTKPSVVRVFLVILWLIDNFDVLEVNSGSTLTVEAGSLLTVFLVSHRLVSWSWARNILTAIFLFSKQRRGSFNSVSLVCIRYTLSLSSFLSLFKCPLFAHDYCLNIVSFLKIHIKKKEQTNNEIDKEFWRQLSCIMTSSSREAWRELSPQSRLSLMLRESREMTCLLVSLLLFIPIDLVCPFLLTWKRHERGNQEQDIPLAAVVARKLYIRFNFIWYLCSLFSLASRYSLRWITSVSHRVWSTVEANLE